MTIKEELDAWFERSRKEWIPAPSPDPDECPDCNAPNLGDGTYHHTPDCYFTTVKE